MNCINFFTINYQNYSLIDLVFITIGLISLGLFMGFRYMYLLKNAKNKLDDKTLKVLLGIKEPIFGISFAFLLFKIPQFSILYISLLIGIVIYFILGYKFSNNPTPPNNREIDLSEDIKLSEGEEKKIDNHPKGYGDSYFKINKYKTKNIFIKMETEYLDFNIITLNKKDKNILQIIYFNNSKNISSCSVSYTNNRRINICFTKYLLNFIPYVNNGVREHFLLKNKKIFYRKIYNIIVIIYNKFKNFYSCQSCSFGIHTPRLNFSC